MTDDPIGWSYTGLYLWKTAVERAGSFDVDKVIAALADLEIDSPAGTVKMHADNHHLAKAAVIGEIRPDGQFDIISSTDMLIEPQPFSQYSN